MKFGENTDSLLQEKSDAVSFSLVCPETGEEYKLSDTDTLLYNDVTPEKYIFQIYRNLLSTLAKNNIMKRERKECSKCGTKITSSYRIPNTSVLIYNCHCGYIWQ